MTPSDWSTLRRPVLILDHFDSFTYNLVQYFEGRGREVKVIRTNTVFSAIPDFYPSHLVLSPGPGHPQEVVLFHQAITAWTGKIPILGVCLGHQAIALHAGAKVVRNYRQMHGKTSLVHHNGHKLFAGMDNPFEACRYHSLVVGKEDAESHGLEVIAWTEEGEVMAVSSKQHKNLLGVQFHPESIFTKGGEKIIANFLAMK